MRVEVELTRADYDQASLANGETSRDVWKPLRVAGVTCMGTAFFLLLARCGIPKGASATLLAVGLALIFIAVFGPDRAMHRGWAAYSKVLRRATWEFSDDAATLILPDGVAPVSWDSFKRFAEGGGVFLLYRDDSVYIIPKRALGSPEAIREFRQLLQEKVQPPLKAFPVIPANRL